MGNILNMPYGGLWESEQCKIWDMPYGGLWESEQCNIRTVMSYISNFEYFGI